MTRYDRKSTINGIRINFKLKDQKMKDTDKYLGAQPFNMWLVPDHDICLYPPSFDPLA